MQGMNEMISAMSTAIAPDLKKAVSEIQAEMQLSNEEVAAASNMARELLDEGAAMALKLHAIDQRLRVGRLIRASVAIQTKSIEAAQKAAAAFTSAAN